MGITVLSLFDGMSCGQIALQKSGIKVDNYYASEIKKYGIQVTQENYPNTIQIGDVTKVSYKDGLLITENGTFNVGKIDLLIGGSPCQNFSIACIKDKRLGLKGEKSKLFYNFLELLNQVKPKHFLLENVASMDKESQSQLNEYLGTTAVNINSKEFVGALRNRLYWTNIPIPPIKSTETNWLSALDGGYVNKKYSPCLLEGHSRPASDKLRLVRRYFEKSFIPVVFESKQSYENIVVHFNRNYKGLTAKEVDAKRDGIDNSIYDTVRVLSSGEMERLQGVPNGYTKSIDRNKAASLLGDGWTVDVISHIFNGLRTL